MKPISYYMMQNYSVEIKFMPDNMFCAEIKEIPGLCAYGSNPVEAIEELELVKEAAFKLMKQQNKEIPLPTMRFEIPISKFESLPYKDELQTYLVV